MWNKAVNEWALSFLEVADIMVESKAKNLASIGLYKEYLTRQSFLPDDHASLEQSTLAF